MGENLSHLRMTSIAAAPPPERKGSHMTISISDQLHNARMKRFETTLIGRVILKPGDKPWRVENLKTRTQKMWNPRGDWKISNLGKGYYTFKFTSIEDRDRIRGTSNLALHPSTIRFFNLIQMHKVLVLHKFGLNF